MLSASSFVKSATTVFTTIEIPELKFEQPDALFVTSTVTISPFTKLSVSYILVAPGPCAVTPSTKNS